MAWTFPDNWKQMTSFTTDARSGGIRRNSIAGGGYINTAAFDYFSDTAAVDEYLYIAFQTKFWGIRFNVGTAFAATSVTFVWEYYNGSAWVAMNVTNPNAFLSTGVQEVAFTPPLNWRSAGSAVGGYSIRCRISAITGITEGGANATTVVNFNLKSLQATGTETSLATARTADLAGTYTILPATTSAVAMPTLEMPTNELIETSFVDIILSGTTAGAGDTVDINGTDVEGNAYTETIDVSAGNGTYTSTKQYRNITTIDANGFTDGTVQCDMKRWGIISPQNPYLIKAHMQVGDGSTTTSLTLNNHLIKFAPGFFWFATAAATFLAGSDSGSGSSAGSVNGMTIYEYIDCYIGVGCHWLRNFGAATCTFKGSRFYIQATGYANGWPFYVTSNNNFTFQDVQFDFLGSESMLLGFVSSSPSFTRVRINGVGSSASISVVSCSGTWTEFNSTRQIRGEIGSGTLRFDTCTMPSATFWVHADAGVFEFLDCPVDSGNIGVGWSGIPVTTDSIRLLKRFDLKVIDSAGTGISGATVVIVDILGNTVATLTTDANGNITQQNLKYKIGDHTAGSVSWTWTTHTPHTVTISKPGYQTKTLKLTMDRKREEIEVLEKVLDMNLSKHAYLANQ